MEKVARALTSYFKSNRITQEQVASKLDCSQAYISGLLSNKRSFGKKSASKWSETFGFNPLWLITGEGEMFLDNALVMVTEAHDNQMEFVMENSNGARFYRTPTRLLMTVKLVPFAAYGRFIDPLDDIEAEREDWEEETFEVPNVVHGQYWCFQVKGDSMDNGLRDSFEEGDRVLVRNLHRQYWNDPVRYKVHPYWVVVTKSSILLKQMVSQDLQAGTFTFHSLNPSVEYSDFTLNMDDINYLYYVLKKKAKEINY